MSAVAPALVSLEGIFRGLHRFHGELIGCMTIWQELKEYLNEDANLSERQALHVAITIMRYVQNHPYTQSEEYLEARSLFCLQVATYINTCTKQPGG